MILNLEPFVGDDIRDAVRESCIISGQLTVAVRFKFNGVEMLVTHNGNFGRVLDERVEHYVEQYHEKIRK